MKSSGQHGISRFKLTEAKAVTKIESKKSRKIRCLGGGQKLVPHKGAKVVTDGVAVETRAVSRFKFTHLKSTATSEVNRI